jgi:hypothetical protein
MKLELSQKEITEAITEWINSHTEYEIAVGDITLQSNGTMVQADQISAFIEVSLA